jgi:beta-hydroxylase
MADFTEYNLNPDAFPFLKLFQDNWRDIKQEFVNFQENATDEERSIAHEVFGPKSKTIKTKGASKYSAFGVLFQGLFIEDYIRFHDIQYPDYSSDRASEIAFQLRQKYFFLLSQAIEKVNKDTNDLIRNAYYGTFHPGLDIKLHVNDNPHMNRGYLGLIVPEGDVAMKICHDKLYWHEGEIMVLDHSYPHCPHNYTEFDRTVLVIDFFKPDKSREEVEKLEREQVRERMAENPYSLGVFGKSDKAGEEDFIKYNLVHQLEWDKALT